MSSRKRRTSAWLAGEHLVGEVVHDEAVVPGEPGDERGRVVEVLQRQRRELEGRDPALGARLQRREVGGREVEAVQPVQVRRHLGAGEPQVGRPDLHEVAAGAHPGQGEGRVGAGADHQPELGRQVVDEEGHPVGDLGAVGEVVVVEDQGDLPVVHAQLVDQPGQHGLQRRLPRLEQRQRRCAGARHRPVEGQQHIRPERGGAPVALVERDPRDGAHRARPRRPASRRAGSSCRTRRAPRRA